MLYVQNSGRGVLVKGLTTGNSLRNLGGSLNPSTEADRALINNRTFLVAFADQLLYAQASRSATANASFRVERDRDLTVRVPAATSLGPGLIGRPKSPRRGR